MMQMWNTKFGVSVVIYFGHTRRPTAKNVIFGFRWISNSINQSESPFPKIDPKTIHSVPHMVRESKKYRK